MANNYFQFKTFTIRQDRCAMKVTTDACIQGAWTPLPQHASHVLDIGAGTGLLSLMVAARNGGAVVDALEYDHDAAQQARENVAASPWGQRIAVHEADARNWQRPGGYDHIITNPPFFNNSLTGDNAARNHARHTLTLSYGNLLTIIDHNLRAGGTASVLLPATEYRVWMAMAAAAGWHEQQRLNVYHKPRAALNRVVSIIGRQATATVQEDLIIYEAPGIYSSAFSALLAPFYLKL